MYQYFIKAPPAARWHGQRQNGRAGDGVAPTPVGRWQRSWGRSALSDGALEDGPGLKDRIPSTKNPALPAKTGFYMVAVQGYMTQVLKNTIR